MTNAEAIETLIANYPDIRYQLLREAVDAAIEALKAQDKARDGMRLIDANEIKKRERDVVLANGAKHRCFDTTMLFEIPIVDAEPVVRCKDCKHNSLNRIIGNTYCNLGIGLSQLYDYCSHGEGREDEKTD